MVIQAGDAKWMFSNQTDLFVTNVIQSCINDVVMAWDGHVELLQ